MKRIIYLGVGALVVLAGFLTLLNTTSEDVQGTDVGGNIMVDTTWDLAGSPYIVIGDVTIVPGITLTIDPGVEVRFSGYFGLFVDGTLIAVGTETNHIVLTSNVMTKYPGNWDRIQINPSGRADIRYSDIQYADTAVFINSSTNNNITYNDISWNSNYGIHVVSSSFNNISRNRVSQSMNWYGINLEGSSFNTVNYNTVWNNWFGIVLTASSFNTLKGNLVFLNNIMGIFLSFSQNNNLTWNVLNANDQGIYLSLSDNNTLLLNNANTNNMGGIYISQSSYNSLDSNHVHNNTYGIYMIQSRLNTLDSNMVHDNDYGVYLGQSSNSTIIKNKVYLNSYGAILLNSSSKNIHIRENDVYSNTLYGIAFSNSSNNIISANDVSLNNIAGISLISNSSSNIIFNNEIYDNLYGLGFASSSNGNVVRTNNMTDNGWGAHVNSSSENLFFDNNFIGNGFQAYDDTNANRWNESYPIGGNYWSDYCPTCQDLYDGSITPQVGGNPDGICDFQFDIDSDSVDFYPLHVDNAPPIITNLRPPDMSTTNDSTPLIGANYTDLTGIALGSVLLMVDAVNVTASATVTTSGVSYVPAVPMLYGPHSVYLEVSDLAGNYKTASWLFNIDATPPTITNLRPPDASTMGEVTPTIGADYSDLSGVEMTSVLLEVDGIDMTSSASVTASDVNYTPAVPLTNGLHSVNLEVKDIYGNLATASWSFNVDSTAPIITNLEPSPLSTTGDNTPTIGADYSDPSGINVSSVALELDGLDVTPSSTVTAGGVTYVPASPLTDGSHSVYLEVRDVLGNLATSLWSFNVDTAPPTITNLTPPDTSTTSDVTPTMSANYSDSSGINVSSVLLTLDGLDVTASAYITASGITYTSGLSLSDGLHSVHLEVSDLLGNPASASWTFYIDSTPPSISNLQPPNSSITNDDKPTIGAAYSDSSGVDVDTSMLTVDSSDVTPSATVTTSGVTYSPASSLSEGIHDVYLEVSDVNGNLATAAWSFEVDMTPPEITNLRPSNGSTTNDNRTTIGANYSDPSGIDTYAVVLMMDGCDMTSTATVNEAGVEFVPVLELGEGAHTVFLEVSDSVGNTASVTWIFMVESADEPPPTRPPDDFLSEYWKLFLALLFIIILLIFILLYILFKRRKKEEEESERQVKQEQEKRKEGSDQQVSKESKIGGEGSEEKGDKAPTEEGSGNPLGE